jgi:hypothetical protein
MDHTVRDLGAHRSGGRIAVLTIRSLDDLAGGAGRYRITQAIDAGSGDRVTLTVVGADELRVTVGRWLDQVIPGGDRS